MKYEDNKAKIRIVQMAQSRWEIQTRHGYILKGDITVSTAHDAELYVKNYLSSFLCWEYEVIPLKGTHESE